MSESQGADGGPGAPLGLGYSTREALRRLRADIARELREHGAASGSRFSFLRDIVSISSEKVLLSAVAYSVTFLYILCLVFAYLVGDSVQADVCLLLEALFLFGILVVNFVVALNEERLRRNEIPSRIKYVLATLEEAATSSVWMERHYPHLCAPYSPCVTLQWTYRDGMIVNLPWALLVAGDVVVLRPGQEVPGRCVSLDDEGPELNADQTFQPMSRTKKAFTVPRVRAPHQNKAYKMLETPYLNNVRMSLEQAQNRPITVFNKQRYLCTVKLMEGIVLPLVISLVVISSVICHIYVLPGVTHWTEIYFLQTIASSLPLLQIIFPLEWVSLNCYGMARLKMLSEKRQKYVGQKSGSLSEDASDPLIEVLSELDAGASSGKSLAGTFFNILVGQENMVTRTSNIIHVLGSLSALCCVDKKGILSWPNPTAEKVFFLRNGNPMSRSSSDTSLVESMGHLSQSNTPDQEGKHCDGQQMEPSTVVEVLDLTHDQNAPFCVEFDDQSWRDHLSRLKPLGLAALLNTCAPAPRHTYSHFCAHLTCEAQLSEDLVPVTNRRCLCELAKQIGFHDGATNIYSVLESLPVFRHLQADTIRRETRFARSLHLSTRVKVPLPHMLGVIVSDPTKRLQLLSQGTADIVLDSCIDYWNGEDLTPLSPSDRKKVLDFYQRSSLTAYCTAFSYKPLSRGIEHNLASTYLELPADCRQIYPSQSEHWSEKSSALTSHFHSSDSLLFNSNKENDATDVSGYFDLQCNQVFMGMVTMQYQAQSDMVELVERLERACIRFVHFSKENELRSRVFSEKMGLESGWNCHISLMSDQRASKPASPVSSQNLPPCKEKKPEADAQTFRSKFVSNANKGMEGCGAGAVRFNYSSNMGSSKALSMSAPGAINLEHTTVKFDSETKNTCYSITMHDGGKSVEDSLPSADSVLEGGEEGGGGGEGDAGDDSPADACRSLSCLTDSTDHSAPVNFDMSNRAKLPRGIENIRPHIEQVDNVPLLVSLFTDCTAATAGCMIHIMQDYGEVVCVIGSAANRSNMQIFMQADASIAVEPLYPVLCQKMPPYEVPEHCVGPIDLARALNAVPCSISLQNKWQSQYASENCDKQMQRDADVSLFSLITMSRHFMTSLWNATQFWMCSVCSISLLQVGSLVGCLPICLSVGGAVWSGMLVTPAISAALTFAPLDPRVMSRPTAARHNTYIDAKVIIFVFWCYGCKFIPSILSVLTLYGVTLNSFCQQIADFTNATDCSIVYPMNVGNVTAPGRDLSQKSWHGWGDDFYDGYYLAQHISLILVTVHLIVISISFVDRNSSIWQKGFWTNKVWSITAVFMLVLQCIFSVGMLSMQYGTCDNWDVCEYSYHVPWPVMLGYILSPILVFCLNEFIKWQEIKENLRYQRRARLDFGTKLGMNSPF